MLDDPTHLTPPEPGSPRPDQPQAVAEKVDLLNCIRHTPPIMLVAAALAMVIIVVGVVFLRSTRYTRLTVDDPVITIDQVLSVSLTDENPARVHVEIIPGEEVFGDQAKSSWRQAAQALPSHLEPQTVLYSLKTGGTAVELQLRADDPRQYDLYLWDKRAHEWRFVPAQVDQAAGLLSAQVSNGVYGLFHRRAAATIIGTVLHEGQTLDGPHAAEINMLFVEGVNVRADGTLDAAGLDIQELPPGNYAILPTIKPAGASTMSDLLADEDARTAHIDAIIALLDDLDVIGIALDYGDIGGDQQAALVALTADLSVQLARHGWLLAVYLPTPAAGEASWDTGGYDWPALGQSADILLVTPPGGPGEYVPGGTADSLLSWAGGEVSRSKLYVAFSTLSVDEWAGQLNPITYDYALRALGQVDIAPELAEAALHPEAGQPLTFNLVGPATNITRDEVSGVYYYEVFAGGGTHRIWLMTASSIRQQLERIAEHQVGGVVLKDLLSAGNSLGMLKAIQEFKVGQPSTLNDDLLLQWTIQDAAGNIQSESIAELGMPLTWSPETEGEYIISANLADFGFSDRGALALIVGGETIGTAPEQEAVVVGAPDSTIGLGSGGTAAVPIPADMPAPVTAAGAFGSFELGGQVNHVIRHPDQMREAGMTWVKFQLAWGEDMDASVAWDLIERGRRENFKVLLSITGQSKYPTEINTELFLEFLRGVAYYGPDAIEVWNEPNLDFEWPRGQIDGGKYTREILAPAYNAIKSVNSNIMVISAAPSPTGAFFGEGGCSLQGYGCDDWLYLQQMAEMGAANYMDCVGAHFNTGATPPSWNTGHPADPGYQHYSWYYGGMLQLYGGTFGRPVCFTELGYLSGEGLGAVPERFNWAAGTTVSQQAAWLAEAAQLSRESGQVRLMIVWNVDFTYWGDDPMAGYAIIRPDGSCPACAALDEVMP